jgi:SAM-dependent methyltransferase
VPDVDMGAFWDDRARENAPYFVENRLRYGAPDLERFWAEGEHAVDTVLELLELRVGPDDDVVELGCGIGRLTRVLAARARSVRALDVSAEMLRRAGELNDLANVEWLPCDGRSLTGVPDASADAFFSHVVFQHVPDPAITLAYVEEIGRVLRPGAWAAFQVSDHPGVHRARGRLRSAASRLLGATGRAPRGLDHPAWLGSAVDLGELGAVASRSGMEVERVVGEGTQFCLVRLLKTQPTPGSPGPGLR